MKKIILFLLLCISVNAQTTIQTVDFETAGSGYTITGERAPSSSTCWARTDGSVISPDVAFTGKQGTYYIYGENTDSPLNDQATVYLTLNSIDVSMYTDLSVKLLVAANNNIAAAKEKTEYLKIQYSFDGGAFVTRTQFVPPSVNATYYAEDTNVDETTDGASLNTSFTEFTYSIPSSGTNLQIRIAANIDQGSEEIGFDNIRVIAGGILPVELTSFTATLISNKVQLNWQTATEVNNYGFEIEKQVSNSDESVGNENNPKSEITNLQWIKTGFIPGAGNSNSPKEYSFVDTNPNTGSVKYRLKQINLDGSFTYYGQLAEVNYSLTDVNEKQLPAEFTLEQNYPNPFNPYTSIKYAISSNQYVSLKVYDILGNEIATLVNEEKTPGRYEVKFNGSNLSSGMYIYKLSAGNSTSTKKLLLMK